MLVDATIQPIRGYARSGDMHIAYQVLGDGPIDMVHVLPFGIPIEVGWELPQIARWWSLIGSFTRSVIFDQRGVGSSDRTESATTIEEQIADLDAVVDAVGVGQFVLAAYSQASPAGIVYANRNSDRVKRLVLYAATARVMRAPDYPSGRTRQEARQWVSQLAAGWGNGGTLDQNQPSVAGDPGVREWYAHAERTLGSPAMAAKMSQALGMVDVREEAKALRVPALIMHRTDDPAIPVGQGRWLAENVPNARWVELDGVDHALYFGDMSTAIQEIQGWVTGKRPAHRAERLLTTLLFTDIANSTQTALELGDLDWRNVLARHHAEVRRELLHQGGVELNSAGDGFLVEFPTPTAAIAAARALRRCLGKLGLYVRAGIHTTECERIGQDVTGVGVHVAARICALAAPGEILVTGTVADVLLGSEFALRPRGEHRLRGIPGQWRVCVVSGERRRTNPSPSPTAATQALP
jgi:class 3 adenylate cyclase/pimeloyl-ACP methyl ester carboxylesterase